MLSASVNAFDNELFNFLSFHYNFFLVEAKIVFFSTIANSLRELNKETHKLKICGIT